MLQRLELIGFKSFAEKTRFEFAPGITAIVGPNGSGKSNVVDAVKWVLGEQSAKALRGGEMTDVIFNGSSTRRSIGLAEVSLTFDNSRQILATDALEVQITRRVYRDGEGEYLVNGQPVRLKDVKDLFLGSGAGHGAYSVIEQGRVDALLMASVKDRRAIFEEAAGISRFKAKKLETLRKLDRVDADLVRVRDILQELEKQLGTLRLQASKAQKQREYSEELRRLRVGLAQREHCDLTETITRETITLQGLQAAAAEADGLASEGDTNLLRIDAALRTADEERRKCEAQVATVVQTITRLEATIKYERIQATGLEVELYRLGKQRVELLERMRTLDAEAGECLRLIAQLEASLDTERERADAAEAVLANESSRIQEIQRAVRTDRDRQVELVGELARTRADAERQRQEIARLAGQRDRHASDSDALESQLAESEARLSRLEYDEALLIEKLTGAQQNHEEYLSYRDELRGKADAVRREVDNLRESRGSLAARAEVLESLERDAEGLGAGVREVMARRAAGDPLLSSALGGLVADVLGAAREVAPLVDLALGETAQFFTLASARNAASVAAALAGVSGRVGLVPLLEAVAEPTNGRRLSEFVHVNDPALRSLAGQLLGNVVVSPSLADALESAKRSTTLRYITPAGELLEPDGRLTVGPLHGPAGIVSRKSELRELHETIAAHDGRIREREAAHASARRQLESVDHPMRALGTEIDALGDEAAALREQRRDQTQSRDRLRESLNDVRAEIERTAVAEREGTETLERLTAHLQQLEDAAAGVELRLAKANEALAAAESIREAKRAEHVHAQVALERAREHLAAEQQRSARFAAEREQRIGDAWQIEEALSSGRARFTETRLAILRATSTSAESHAEKESFTRELAAVAARQARLHGERDRWLKVSQGHRSTTAERKDRAHAHEMLVRDLTHRRDAIAGRILEDYAIDLSVPNDVMLDTGEIPDPETAEEQIDELRRKLARLGGVNQESLGELDELERRESELRTQHDDLAESHKKLGDIIEQLNADSRKQFVETLATVRVHFQELFRKLFAGGQADIVLEENADPLESGIEITARPPGKELRSISLLSGGERTLTAIALLLAIFRSKPSPFCILDEVDAALDEANTARLAGALGEFLDRSQFIVITHKKRTMAVADVLYGVTMQESGVSKQVSVRFEDWPDEENEYRAAA